MYLGLKNDYSLKIYCDETRPLLQGARLTAYELSSAGMDVTLLCDNMAGQLMRSGKINAVFVGCDRVAANGDVANKIGTSMVALCAKHYNVPFYVSAPTSTIDLNTASGNDIKIEERPADEVTTLWYKERMAPENISVFNPAFDITDNSLITAIITEKGIVYPPYDVNLKKTLG
ncbi:MAG: S-methyl-5-thioribose-1-phosphate isomerase, partial [Lachnospiraceae bacterium]|nr:S-methyl-5-thioribose-1-phosphate isomerase [Lachnospiraceae bacterium]